MVKLGMGEAEDRASTGILFFFFFPVRDGSREYGWITAKPVLYSTYGIILQYPRDCIVCVARANTVSIQIMD